ncbi:MAG: hypothetical protein PVI99_10045 [Anaerolineales bacterium]|jgi:Tol biopolymer transport system component
MNRIIKLLLVLFFGAFLTACSLPFPAANSDPPIQEDQIATSVAATQQAVQKGGAVPESSPEILLPHALYFLSEEDDDGFQIWMIEQDGLTKQKFTAEPAGIDDYAVSRSDGKIAYITQNQLVTVNQDGSGRRVWVDGSADISEEEEYYLLLKIIDVSWSPDGRLLAYGRNGLHIIDTASETDAHIIENEIDDQGNGFIIPEAIYSPQEWSPDGSQLLVNIGFYEAGTLGIYHLETQEIVRLGDGILCCHPAWSPDSRSVVVGSPFLGMTNSGLWRADTGTGRKFELIPNTSPDNTLNFAGWPLVMPNGDLRYFYSNTPEFPNGEVSLVMVQSDSDGATNRVLIRPEKWINYEALWAEDGNLAVAVQPVTGQSPGWPRTGPIVVIPASNDPVQPLGVNGFMLQWGP